jgi:DNA adenine methylase
MTEPFLKWPGGKRWAAETIAKLIHKHLDGTYYEPFLGGGAVFFHLLPKKAVLSDTNSDLILTYQMVQSEYETVLEKVRAMEVSSKEYYRIRAMIPRKSITKAARLLYLNRTAFGGIYRLNSKGQFNVPFGGGQRTPAPLWERNLLKGACDALNGITIKCTDFERMIDSAGSGDVVYCDPTYTVAHDNNSFVRYNEKNFSWIDQKRLSIAARAATARGAMVIVSNAHHRSIRDLYPDARVRHLKRLSLVSTDPAKRCEVKEYLFIMTPKKR